MNSKWKKRIVILLALVAIFVVLRMTVFAPKPISVSSYAVTRGLVEETVTNSKAGTIKVRRRANLSPQIGGQVVYLGGREGQRVKAGDLLLRLDDSELKANLVLAERALQSSKANMEEACVAAQLAKRELERNKELNKQGIIPDATLDQLGNRLDVSQARCESTKAEIKRAEASVEVARASWGKTELRAPFDGIIVQLTAELGEYVTPSPPGVPIPPVIDILDDRSIYVEAPMDETDAGKLKKGLPVRISLDPYPDQSFPGVLTRVGSFIRDVEGQNRTVDIEAELDDKEFAKKLLAGTSADIEVILNKKDNVLRIPAYSLLEGNRVLVIEGNKLVSRQIRPGLRNWEFVEVQGGLKEGEKITLSLDLVDVKEGALVTVSKEAGK
jgi:HlyD family secretion protein